MAGHEAAPDERRLGLLVRRLDEDLHAVADRRHRPAQRLDMVFAGLELLAGAHLGHGLLSLADGLQLQQRRLQLGQSIPKLMQPFAVVQNYHHTCAHAAPCSVLLGRFSPLTTLHGRLSASHRRA